jgi:hypothetical protein
VDQAAVRRGRELRGDAFRHHPAPSRRVHSRSASSAALSLNVRVVWRRARRRRLGCGAMIFDEVWRRGVSGRSHSRGVNRKIFQGFWLFVSVTLWPVELKALARS